MKRVLIILLVGCLFAAAARYVAGGGPVGWTDSSSERLAVVVAFDIGAILGDGVTVGFCGNEQDGEE